MVSVMSAGGLLRSGELHCETSCRVLHLEKIMETLEDKENWTGSSFWSETQRQAPTRAVEKAPTPKLCLGEFQKPLYLDFRSVNVGASKTLKFGFELLPEATETRVGHGAVTLQVDRAPKTVEVELTDETGSITWRPEVGGMMREVILLRFNGRHRVQITIHGQAVGDGPTPSGSTHVGPENGHNARGRGRTQVDGRRPLRALSCPPQQRPPEPAPVGFEKRLSKLSTSFRALEQRLGSVLTEDQAVEDTSGLTVSVAEPPPGFDLGPASLSEEQPTPLPRGRAASRGTVSSPPRSNSLPPPIVARRPAMESGPRGTPSSRSERAITVWLNSVLCPPSLAQTVPHPAECIKQQRVEVRSRAKELYASATLASVRLSVDKEIAAKKLLVRDDKDMYADLNLREAFVELLLSYQPQWLHVGLEVVLGVEVSRLAKRDGHLVHLPITTVLRKLIIQRVLSDPDIVSQGRTRAVGGRYGEVYKHQLRANTMRRFFALILFLDRAKSCELLPSRRPLFKPSAVAKSSAEVLLAFSKDYLSGEGNLIRHMAGLGYTVAHVQIFLDEFDFRVSCLARDLRDGVRLARLVDLMHKAEGNVAPVCSQLRVPPVSRLQKVHNVKVALERLVKGAGMLRGHRAATPDDIVDGHREKTIALMWEMVRHYELEPVVASLCGLHLFQALARRRITQRRYQRIRTLALLLQRLYRSRRLLIRCRSFPPHAVTPLQAHWRGHLARAHLQRRHSAALLLQAWTRGCTARATIRRMAHAVLVLQAAARMRLQSQRYHRLRRGVLATQALHRGRCARRHLATQQHAAVQLQRAHRRHVAQRRYRALQASALCLQALARGLVARRHFRVAVASVALLQRALRAHYRRKVQRATRLQAHWRGLRARRHTALLHAAARLLQATWRGHSARHAYATTLQAAVTLQRHVRGSLSRLHYQALLQRRQSAALLLQRCHRGAATRRHVAVSKASILLLQAHMRRALARRTYLAQRAAALRLQAFLRCHVARQHYTSLCRAQATVARVWRGHTARSQLLAMQQAATVLQAVSRGLLARLHCQALLRRVVQLQSHLRAWHTRAHYVTTLRRIIGLQCLVRRRLACRHVARLRLHFTVLRLHHGHQTRSQLRTWHQAATTIQRSTRGGLARLALKRAAAATTLARHWRGTALRLRLARLVSLVVQVQRGVRRMRVQREATAQSAALLLQRMVRGHSARRHVARLHAHALTLQRSFRGYSARRAYHCTRRRVVQMQARVRGNLLRARLARCQRGMTRLQAIARGFRIRVAMAFTHSAATTVQRHIRGLLARRDYQATRAALLTLQSHARAALAVRRFRAATWAVKLLQATWRGVLAHRAAARYSAAVLLQRHWRGKLARTHFHTSKAAALRIQTAYRASSVRANYLNSRQAIITIQTKGRGFLARRAVARWHRAAGVLQLATRAFLYRRHEQQHVAATHLQRLYRGMQARGIIATQAQAATQIAALVRGYSQRRAYLYTCKCIITIQNNTRGFLARQAVARWHKAARVVQLATRAFLYRRHEQQHVAATHLQRVFRGMKARGVIATQAQAVTQIAALVRGYSQRRTYLYTCKCIITIQTNTRGFLARQAVARWHKAARVVQLATRAFLYRRHEQRHIAATHLQRVFRGMQARGIIATQAQAATQIAALLRGSHQRRAYLHTRQQVITLQSLARMQAQRAAFVQLQQAALLTQRLARGTAARRRLHTCILAATALQRLYRGCRVRRDLRAQARAAVLLQSVVRAHVARGHYLLLRQRLVLAQATWRKALARTRLASHHAAAVQLQSLYRAHRQARAYAAATQAVRRLQCAVRRWLATRQWAAGLAAVCALQRAFRFRRLVRAMAAHREAVITLQSLWRARQARLVLQRLRLAAAVLQAWARTRITRQRFLNWRRAIYRAQAVARAWLVRRRSNAKLRALRSKVQDANARAFADPSMQIGNRHRAALDVLLNSKSCSHILKCCITLEISTRLSRLCCEALVSANGMEKLVSLIRSCNRSTPHMELLRHVLRVLQNVAAYEHLVPSIGQVPHIVDTLVELLQNFREKDLCHTFMPAALLLLRATSICPLAKAELGTADVQRRLGGIYRLLQRKGDQERASKSTRWVKAADRDITVTRPIQVLHKLVLVQPLGHGGNHQHHAGAGEGRTL